MSDAILAIDHLTKTYRGRRGIRANDGVDLTVGRGEVVGLLGHNGAGKTTLVNQLVGLVRPDSGTIMLCGIDAVARPDLARRLTSVQAQANVPITGLSPRAAITLVGMIRGGERRQVQRRTAELIEALDLGPWANTPAEKISGGVARLTAFCMAAIMPGSLLVFDEPTNDVDPVRRRLLWAHISALAEQGTGVLLVTHSVQEAERVVDRVTVLDHGRVLAAGSPGELTATMAGHLTLEIDLIPGRIPPWPPSATETHRSAVRASAQVPADHAAATVAWATEASARGDIDRYSLTAPSLEDIYISLTTSKEQAA